MGAGLINLIVNNNESDKYFTSNPKITFFKSIYKQYTNFGIETVRQDFNKIPFFNNEVSCKLALNGDLINKIYLVIELPQIKSNQTADDSSVSSDVGWINALGNHIYDFIDIRIGGKTIDTIYPQWMDIYSSIFLSEDKQKSFNYLTLKSNSEYSYVENGKTKQVLMIPLLFWFFNNNQALPLLCLQYHQVTIHVKFNKIINLIKSDKFISNPLDIDDNPIEIIDAYLNVDYIFIDKQERNIFVNNPYECLIEQTQFTGLRTINPNSNIFDFKIDHKYNVKELYFMFIPHTHKESNSKTGNLHSEYNYRDNLEPTIKQEILKEIDFSICAQPKHPTISSKYYLGVNNFNNHSNIPNDFIYSHSFALNPEDLQPSGTINLTEVDDARFKFKLNPINDYVDFYFFSRNYNILRINSGMGGLAWYD
jgi:hypothetical protein